MTASVPTEDFDVIVIGSGAAGMTAALTAAANGLQVLVLEKSHYLGGTSSMSGAGLWIPANHLATAAGIDDSPEEAVAYIANGLGDTGNARHRPLWEALCYNSGPMLKFVEDQTPLQFGLTPEPDPIDVPGAKAKGRMLSPFALPKRVAGAAGRKLRPSTLPHLFTYHDMFWPNPWKRPLYTGIVLAPKLLWRLLTGARGQGSALMAGLFAGALKHGIDIRTKQTVTDLIKVHDRVTGVRLEDSTVIGARRGVLLATGGFEWNKERYEKHFPGPTDWLTTPNSNSGGGLTLAEKAGAAVDAMDQANIHPALPTRYEGRPHGMPVAWHVGPHAIVVNSRAERFASEYDYNLGAELDVRDENGKPINLPAWLICDGRFLRQSLPFTYYAMRSRGWVRKARSLPELAGKLGLDAAALTSTVKRFNGFCQAGCDLDFHRGEPLFERFRGGFTADGRNMALGAIQGTRFYAMPINRSILGTKGGPSTDEHGRVFSRTGDIIEGLYAAGNAMANPIGTRVVGAGTTVGPHMTMGYICALDMLSPRPR